MAELRSMAEPSSSSVTSTPTVLQAVEKEWIDSLKMPKNFITWVFSLLLQPPQRYTIQIRSMVQQWMRWDVLESLASYHSIVKLLFGIVRDAMNFTRLQVRPVTWLLLLDSSRIRIRTMPSRRRYFNVCPKIFAIFRINWSRSFEIPKATKIS
ncbi:hypothetical protein B0H14DRAFT_98401 [Mycena olivaceomarginata]|nr:hypothetical protein B0H14DRAFT_98401 [Mycena olivaceomarginata]